MRESDVLMVIRSLDALLGLASSLGVNVNRFIDIKNRAAAEGRDVSRSELNELRDTAIAAIERAENA